MAVLTRILLYTAAALLLLTRAAPAQTAAPALPSSGLRVFVVTFGPGDEAWEKFGHNAIRIHNPEAPLEYQDIDYNWGFFDFEQKDFYVRFIQGRMLYMMQGESMETAEQLYRNLNRSIYVQELNLAESQKQALRRLLAINDTDANRYYRYDYYRDNCSTRVRDVIDNLIGQRLSTATKAAPSGATFRFHTRRLTAETPWLYTALETVLGHPVDVPISQWDEMFLPFKLRERLREVTVPDPMGSAGMVPLVKLEITLFEADRPPVPQAPPNTVLPFGAVGLVLSGLLLGVGHFVRRSFAARVSFVVVAVPWLLLMGVGGAIMVWGWGFTDHVVAARNENLFHVSPLMLPLAVLYPLLVFDRRRGSQAARWVAIGAAGLAVVGVLLKALPAFHQVNWDIIALTLPVSASLAFIAWRLASVRAGAPAAGAGK